MIGLTKRKQTVAAYLNDWVESYARVNLRPSTYDGYKKTIANYINPYIGGVTLNQLTPAMVDKMFQQIIDKGLKPSTAAGAKRVLSVALSHARKYRYIETNAAKDTLTKFGKGDKTPDPYTPEQVKALMQRVEGTVWEMPVILGGLYGMRRSEILGLRWRNVDLENNTFDVTEQLPFKVPPKTKVIEEMAPPKSNGRKLPITELARPFFLKQLAMQEVQKEQAAKDGKPYYDNDLVVAKPDGAPIAASWVSSQFGKLLEDLDMPHIRFHDLRHPYVKYTTKIFSLRLMDFQAQAYPDARRKTRGACQLHRGGQSQSPVRPLCNRKQFSCLLPQSKMSWILYAISMRLSGYTSTRSISSSASSVVSASASKIALDASLRLSCRACSSCFCFACANTAA